MMKTEKKAFLTPEVVIVSLNVEDVIATSQGHDSIDNWMTDKFDLT